MYWTLFVNKNIDGFVMYWDADFCMTLLKAEWQVNQEQGEQEFKCYTIWQMMTAMLHSNRQHRTQKDGDTEKRCQNVVYNTAADYWIFRQKTVYIV